jgi:DNA-binding transcriptional regulator YdaS (Cro superfamily)
MSEHTDDTPLKALEEAIEIAKGVSNLAARIERGQSTVSMWLTRGAESPKTWKVPADACPAIERETGVRCERLHPGAAWEVLRMQAQPEQKAA